MLPKTDLLLLLLLTLTITTLQCQESCRKHGAYLYEQLSCEPIKDKSENPCPTSYDCSHYYKRGNACYFKGQKYEPGEWVHINASLPSCNVGYRCDQNGTFICSIVTCAEWSTPKNATRVYDVNTCCSTDLLYEPFNKVPKCEVNGTVLYQGQRFYPNDSCSVCVCKEDYSGKYEEPYCKPLQCGIELSDENSPNLDNYCAAVYENKQALCFPKFWACSEENDVIKPTKKQSDSSGVCRYGNKTLRIGETIEKFVDHGGHHTVICECKLPPLLTCVITNVEYYYSGR